MAAKMEMVVRRVFVDRTRNPQQMINDTGLKQCIDSIALRSVPRSQRGKVDVVFFRLGPRVTDVQLAQAYRRLKLKCDPYAQAQANIDDPNLTRNYRNCANWKDRTGRWCFIMFGGRSGKRLVCVHRFKGGWFDNRWFAGVRPGR